ncbi:MAG: polysaccharide lyase 8 family protein [Acidobacteria bacterium]|nr:polysaccharide lyase 8 family protein [Acidobacteriota bacterium]
MREILACLLLGAVALPADEFDSLRLRWRQTMTGGETDAALPQIRSRLTAIESTARGYWDSMDKSPTRRALWSDLASATSSSQITGNWRRLRDMALAWATPGQSYHGSAELLAAVRGGMDWMEANRYNARVTNKYDNWWDWEIGSPIEVGNILILLYDELTPQELAKHAAAIDRFVADPRIMVTSTVSTGANRVWKCKGAILRAIVARDAAKLKLSSDALSPVFAYVTAGDGFYEDGSFIQHGRHPYTGGYGNSLLNDVADVLFLLAGSTWDVTDPARENVWRWVVESFEPVIYRGAMMDMVRGRELSRSGSLDHAVGHGTASAILRLSSFAPSEIAPRMKAMLREWYISDTARNWATGRTTEQIMAIRRLLDDDSVAPRGELIGSWVFASMDRVVHLRPGWGLGIAMHSSRVYNYESINRENLRAWHTSDGMTYLYNQDLAQFSDNYWPTVDPQRLPGTTVIAGSTARQSQVGGSNIAGGATLNGFTAAMMRLRPDGRELEANKSWFLFDGEVVAMGSGIHSTAAGKAVETIVENRLIRGAPEFTRAEDGTWAHLADTGTGYYFPTARDWQTLREDRAGSWSLLNAGGSTASLTRRFQTIWFDHGAQPAGAAYAYALLPGLDADQTAAYAAAPQFRILEHTPSIHAVVEETLGLRAASFFAAVQQNSAGIASDGVASVLALETEGVLIVGVADPTQANNTGLRITFDRDASEVIEKDAAVQVEQLAPVVIKVDTRATRGRTLRVRLRLVQ